MEKQNENFRNHEDLPALEKTLEVFGLRFFSKLTAIAGLYEHFESSEALTLLVPRDEAFYALSPGELSRYLSSPEELASLIRRHALPGKLSSEDLSGMAYSRNMEGGLIPLKLARGTLRVGSACVVDSDIEASHGIIHTLDSVLRQKDVQKNQVQEAL